MKDRHANRHKRKYCDKCKKEINGAGWSRHIKQVHCETSENVKIRKDANDIEEFKDSLKEEQSATKKDIESLTAQIHRESEELKQELIKIHQENEELKNELKIHDRRSCLENSEVLIKKENMSDEQLTVFSEFNRSLKNEAVSLFLATQSVEDSTRKQYFSFLKSFFKDNRTLSVESIKSFFSKHRKETKYSTTTLSEIKKVLNTCCTGALGWKKNQFPRIKVSSKKKVKESCYIPTKTEVETLIDNLKILGHTRECLLIDIMFVSALRPVDMIELSFKNFMIKDENFMLVTTEQKTGKVKNVYIPKRIYEEAQVINGILFPFLTKRNYRKWMKRFFEANCAINGHKLLPKSLRKASITEIYKGATNAAEQGSHKTVATTFLHYIDPIVVSNRLWRDSDKLQ